MNNKLTAWYQVNERETIKEQVKENIKRRYSFSDGEFVSIGGGFKFLYDDETGGEIAITFIEENNALLVSVEGTWSWETIEIFKHCLPAED